MMTRLLVLILLLGTAGQAQKKPAPYVFSADRVYAATAALTGDSATWPVVIALADRDIERNSFILEQSGITRLKNFAQTHADVKLGRTYFASLLKAGARVFASETMNKATLLLSRYDRSIRDGALDGAVESGAAFLAAIDEMAREIELKRTEEVDALIAQRQGEVAKRRGLLGSWSDARTGDLLKQSDGVKTGDASFAQLAFTDGCDVMVDPNSTVLIRESKMDKLDRSIRRDIALIRGGLLTTLTASAKERNNLRLQAGSSQSEVRSSKFWASAVEERRVRLSNYDGTMNVTSNRSSVKLSANQGTVVEQGNPPMKPVELLPPPQLPWNRIDTTIYAPDLLLVWEGVRNAAEYRLEISPSKDFNKNIKVFDAGGSSFTLRNISLGILFARLYAVDRMGLRGIESPVYKIIRVEDKIPPPIYVNGWETDRKYTILPTIAVTGTTEPDAQLTADGQRHTVGAEGTFTLNVTVGAAERIIVLRSVDRSGNARTRTLSVIPMDSAKVMRVDWNVPSDQFTLSPAADEISGRGTSYPSIKITATLGDQTSVVQTDSQGNWAISLHRIPDRTLTLVFESLSDNTVIGTRTLQVE